MRETFEKSCLLGASGPTAVFGTGFKGTWAAVAASALLHGAVTTAAVLGWSETTPTAGSAVVVELVFISPDPGGSGESAGNESRADLSVTKSREQGVMQPVPVERQAQPPPSAPPPDTSNRPTEKPAAEKKPSGDLPVEQTAALQSTSQPAPTKPSPPKAQPAALESISQPATGGVKTVNLSATTARGKLDASTAGVGREGYLDGPKFQMGSARNPLPRYPRTARRRGIEGRVILRVVVGADGLPLSIDVHESSGHSILDRAAVKAFRKWRFQPARRAGTAVTAPVDIPISFRLQD
jgi:protein TonB